MSTYREILARRETLQASLPRREYITNEEFRRLKSNLTRAKNSGDPARVLRTVEQAVEVFNTKIWPDDWAMWRVALEDAAWAAEIKAREVLDPDESNALYELSGELHAASLVLFR
jgi:hypothetical protein